MTPKKVPLENISVTLKLLLPHFWADGAKIWFTQAESQFAVKNITSELTKYRHVVAGIFAIFCKLHFALFFAQIQNFSYI